MSTSVTNVVSHFPSAENGFTTTLASTISSGATTVPLNSVAGYTNGEVIVFVIDPSDATKKQTFTGIVDTAGVQITSVVWTAGTNQAHAGGATVVDYATATHISMVTKGLLVEHNQDGTHGDINADSVTAATGKISTTAVSKLEDAGTPLSTYRANYLYDFVYSGGVWSGDSYGSTRNASMTAMVCYINGRRISISAVTARSFTASKDTYVDVLDNADGTGTLVYTEATNNAASPSLAANSIRIAIIVTGASNIANAGSVNQGEESKVLPIASSIPYAVTDSLGNLICPRDPNRKILGYRQILSSFTSTTTPAQTDITGLSVPFNAPGNRKVKTTAFFPWREHTATGTNVTLDLVESTTTLSTRHSNNTSANSQRVPADLAYTNTPSAGLHTYKLMFTSNQAGTTTFTAGSTSPAYIMVELV